MEALSQLGRGHGAFSREVGKASLRSDSGASWTGVDGGETVGRSGWKLPGRGQIACPEVTVSVVVKEGASPVWPHFRPVVSPCL